MKRQKAETKKHHYIPKMYLKNFTNKNSELFVYDKKNKKIFKQGVEGTFWKKYFYTSNLNKFSKRTPKEVEKIMKKEGINISKLKKELDINPDRLERKVFGETENLTSVIFDKIINLKMLQPVDRVEFSIYIAQQYTRTPFYYDFIANQTLKNIKNISIEKKISNENLKKINNLTIKDIEKEYIQSIMIKNILRIDTLLKTMNWDFIYIPNDLNKLFLTSDNPVIFNSNQSKAFLPISNKICMIMNKTDSDIHNVRYIEESSEEKIDYLNSIIISNSNRYLISNSEEFLKDEVKDFN